jgi:hypothetical protein|tara:strand:+ start:787 stop:984 length:198 start_codon:yes stop_codon:yes gene_type:complete
MPKSKNRKNHKKKVAARNMRLKNEAKKMQETLEAVQEAYVKKMSEEAKNNPQEDSGEVPFTLGSK